MLLPTARTTPLTIVAEDRRQRQREILLPRARWIFPINGVNAGGRSRDQHIVGAQRGIGRIILKLQVFRSPNIRIGEQLSMFLQISYSAALAFATVVCDQAWAIFYTAKGGLPVSLEWSG
jgi:hypothetical protein